MTPQGVSGEVGFVSHHPQGDHNLFSIKDFVPLKVARLALFRNIDGTIMTPLQQETSCHSGPLRWLCFARRARRFIMM